jgi:hypothetical protein
MRGRNDTAREVAFLAKNRFPKIRGINPEVFSIPENEPNVAVAINHTPTQNVISLTKAQDELESLKKTLYNTQWEKALLHIEAIEKSPLSRDLAEQLLYWRITIHGNLSNQTEVSWYMRRLLESGKLESARLRTLAVELHTCGHADSAFTILREVLRKHPDAKWATDQITLWTAEIKTTGIQPTNETDLK